MKKLLMINLCLLWSALVLGQTTEKTLIYFNSGQSDLTPASKTKLNELLGLLKTKALVEINLYGHTDSEGTEAANQILSVYRAMSTNTYLISNGADLGKIKMHAMGETQAISSKADENRRVEIVASYNDIVIIPEIVDIVLPEIPNLQIETGLLASTKPLGTPIPAKPFCTTCESSVQKFNVLPTKTITITGKQGTIIIFPKNSFVNNSGIGIKDSIRIELIEAYDKSDMILCNLQTIAQDQLLESAGMVRIKAYQGKKELKLKYHTRYEIQFPSDEYYKDMMLFNSDTTKPNIDWREAEAPPAVIAGDSLPKSPTKKMKGDMIERTPFWYSITHFIPNMRASMKANREYRRQKVRLSRRYSYGFKSSQLDWINCDRFINKPNKTDIIIDIDIKVGVTYTLLFESLNSAIHPKSNDITINGAVFRNIPANMTADIVAILIESNDLVYYARQTIQVETGMTIKLNLEKISVKELKTRIKTLDKKRRADKKTK